ncbi:MAG: hypothetical protein RBR23_08435 [Arcobacteraceae bacterium]|nr:hypothetical protein [Arcobacteraceae bacterium]
MKEFNYNHWLRITDGIEKYILAKGDNHFTKNGINFSVAFARFIYFIMRSKTQIRDIIKNAMSTNNCKVKINLNNDTVRSILTYMYPEIHFEFTSNPVDRSIDSSLDLEINGIKHYKYIFLIPNVKFIRYFSNLINKMDDCCCILLNLDCEAVELCKSYDFKYVSVNYKYIDNNLHFDIDTLWTDFKINLEMVEQIQPLKIIVPEGNLHSGEIYNLIGKTLNIECICIQQGWSPVYHVGFRDMHYDKFLTWGNKFSKLLLAYNPKQKFIATGSHVLNAVDRTIQTNNVGFFLQHYSASVMFGENEYFELLECAYTFAKRNVDVGVIIRKHPGHNIEESIEVRLKELNNVHFMHPEHHTLGEVLQQIKISVAIHSTVLLESLAYDIIPVIFNNTAMPHYEPNLAKENVAIEVKNMEQALDNLEKLFNDAKYMKYYSDNISNIKSEYFLDYSDNAIKNILNEIGIV